jgi:hypothetical protein
MRPNRTVRWLLIACVAALAGCGAHDKKDTGVLVVPYELGNHRECADLGITTVRAELDQGDYVEEADCDAGQVRFNLIDPGNHEVVVYGLDKHDVPVMDSLADGPVKVDVVGGDTTVVVDPALKLTAAPAKLELRWAFGFGTCESTAIDHFGISAWRSDGSDLLMETAVDCTMPGEGHGQYRIVPDMERDLSGDELGEVDVQAYDKDMIAIGEPVTFMFVAPGAGGAVKLSMNCDDGGCKGSGAAD